MPILGHLRRTKLDFADISGNVGPNWVESGHSGAYLNGTNHKFQAT